MSPVIPPVAPPVIPPGAPPVALPVVPPLVPPVVPPIVPPVVPPIVPPVVPPVQPPVVPPVIFPVVNLATTIPISWTSSGSQVDKYVVMWERDTTRECPDVDIGNHTITDGSTDYVIRELEEDSRYFILVKAINKTGSAVSRKVAGITFEAGE